MMIPKGDADFQQSFRRGVSLSCVKPFLVLGRIPYGGGGGCLRAFFGTLGASPRTTPLSLRGRDGAGSGPGGFSGGVQRVDHLTHCQIWRFAEWEMPPQGVGG